MEKLQIAWIKPAWTPLSAVRFSLIILGVLLLSACQKQTTSNANPLTTEAAPVASSQPGSQREAQTTNSAPVELNSSGITADKTSIAYKIKVDTDKPIDEVHLALKEMDGKGKVIEDTTIVWQNIVGSTRRPIENGKTYEDQTAWIRPRSKRMFL